jgi:hypothetical protein
MQVLGKSSMTIFEKLKGCKTGVFRSGDGFPEIKEYFLMHY